MNIHLTREMQAVVDTTVGRAGVANVAARLWAKDPTLWRPESAEDQALIAERLGWLTSFDDLQPQFADVAAFAEAMAAAGFQKAVLCGMGGSSLAPDMLRTIFGAARIDVRVLDSTHPAAVRALEAWSNPAETLYIVASKSGGTVEVLSFFRYFWAKVAAVKGERAGENFMAITDPDTSLGALAAERGFRKVFINPPEIGGRFSALSLFGLVPAALLGIDFVLLAGRASVAAQGWRSVGLLENGAIWPGLALGALAQTGRNKVTFVLDPAIAAFGDWLEQLIAESTGKDGVGLLTVVGELVRVASAYGDDRVFVYLRLDGSHDAAVQGLIDGGQPVLQFDLRDAYDLGAEMLRWEIATAVAGWVLQINPFDQPNVQSAKTFTKALLANKGAWSLPVAELAVGDATLPMALADFLRGCGPGHYVALLVYLPMFAEIMTAIEGLRDALAARTGAAMTVGYGPRYLHSTGQLHKGGADDGWFIEIVEAGIEHDALEIPETDDTFGELVAAQAVGDLQALLAAGRRVLRVAVGRDVVLGINQLTGTVKIS